MERYRFFLSAEHDGVGSIKVGVKISVVLVVLEEETRGGVCEPHTALDLRRNIKASYLKHIPKR